MFVLYIFAMVVLSAASSNDAFQEIATAIEASSSGYCSIEKGARLSSVRATMSKLVVLEDNSVDLSRTTDVLVCIDGKYLMIFYFENGRLVKKKIVTRSR
jgi:hypothetical protein